MNRTVFTQARIDDLQKDFVEYSGGFEPHEAYDEKEMYIQVNCPPWCTEEQLEEFFDWWESQPMKPA